MKKSLSRLVDLCHKVTDGTHDTPKPVPEGVPLIKAKEIVGGVIDFDNCSHISYKEHLGVISRSKPEIGDILFAHIGASLGEACLIKTTREFSIKNVALFKPNPSKIDNRYLYYSVIGPTFQNKIKNRRTGSAQPFVSLDILRNFPIEYHENLGTQGKIASILSAYDDLIVNNIRRIKILEEMAQTIYNEWFVKFRFPGYEKVKMVDSEQGEIPEAWEVVEIREFGNIVTGKTPSTRKREYYGKFMLFIKTPDMHNNKFVINTSQSLSKLGAESQRNKTIPANSICVSCIGTVGIVSITAVDSQTNQQINSILLNDNSYLEYLFFSINGLKKTIELYSSAGATMSNLNKEKFSSLKSIKPEKGLILKFNKLVSPLFNNIKVMQTKIDKLKICRDLFLPKLISGELDVEELDIYTGLSEQ